jgi:beta-1,4-mannosyl-glycoprotein beta-1,4-N-acetylglucosaminyltransferase
LQLFDCFTFFNELDLLDLRLAELDPVVDRFVIGESPLTFTGKAKPLVFAENRQRFSRYLHKIEHIVIDDMPQRPETTAWHREWHQRNALARGLGSAAPDDLVMLSDVDEIPRPAVLASLKADPDANRRITILESELYLYFLNTRPIKRFFSDIQAPRVVPRHVVREMQTIRAFRARFSKNPLFDPVQPFAAPIRALFDFGRPLGLAVIPNATWHFTYMGGADKVREKVLSYAHTEMQTAENTSAEALEARIARREAIVDWGPLEDIALDATFPAVLLAEPKRWAHMLAPR